MTSTNNSQNVTFTADITDNDKVDSVTIDGKVVTSNTNTNIYQLTKSYKYNEYADYDFAYTDIIEVIATDPTGNTTRESITISITKKDNVGPVITEFVADINNIPLTSTNNSQDVTFTVKASDDNDINEVLLENNTISVQTTDDTYKFKKTYNFNDYDFGKHTDTLTLTVSDNQGNTTSSNITITIDINELIISGNTITAYQEASEEELQNPKDLDYFNIDYYYTPNVENYSNVKKYEIDNISLKIDENNGYVTFADTVSSLSNDDSYTFKVTVKDDSGEELGVTEELTIHVLNSHWGTFQNYDNLYAKKKSTHNYQSFDVAHKIENNTFADIVEDNYSGIVAVKIHNFNTELFDTTKGRMLFYHGKTSGNHEFYMYIDNNYYLNLVYSTTKNNSEGRFGLSSRYRISEDV